MSISIRLAALEDAALVHGIMLEAFAEYAGVLGVASGANAEREEDVRAAIRQGGAILALLKGRPVGCARFTLHPDHLYFGRLSTRPEFRGQGIGRAMIAWLEEHARSLGLPEVQLNVRMSLLANWRLYRSLGYETVSVVPHPRGADIYVTMVKRLRPAADNGFVRSLLDRYVGELRAAEPNALAVMLFGSLSRGTAGPFSDIDLRVVTQGEPRVRDRVQFVPRPDGGLVHLSIGSRSIAEIMESAADPERWAWMIETYSASQTLWETSGLGGRLLSEIRAREPRPEAYAAKSGYYLETLLEYAAKLKNAVAQGDDQGVRASSAHLADLCVRLLRPLNPVVTMSTDADFWQRVSAFPVAPANFAADLSYCRGLLDEPRPIHLLTWRALRLAVGTIDLVAANRAALHLPDDLARSVADGTVTRCLQQVDGWRWTY